MSAPMSAPSGGFIELCGLWRRRDKEGKDLPGLSGKLGGARVLILKNKHKQPGDKKPDYHLVLARAEPPKPAPEREPGEDEL